MSCTGGQRPPSLWLTHRAKDKIVDGKKKTPSTSGAEEKVREGTQDEQEKEKPRGWGSSICLYVITHTACSALSCLQKRHRANPDPQQRSLRSSRSAQRPLADSILPGGRAGESHDQEKVFILSAPAASGPLCPKRQRLSAFLR